MQVRRARRALKVRSPGGEFKARYARPKVIERFLSGLAAEELAVYVVAVDKATYRETEGEELYRQVIARAVRHCVERTPRLHLTLDRRYTNRKQQTALETAIRESLADITGHVVVIEPMDSTAKPELQAVDFVAWAFGQKYERGDEHFARLLAERVVVEEVLN